MNTIAWVLLAALTLLMIERVKPAHKLRPVKNWWFWVVLLNACQAGVAWLGSITWDEYLSALSLYQTVHWPLWLQIFTGYVLITFIYYWWHRARHEVPILWRCLHQLHHSPARMEVAMSFYKHPVEIIVNGFLSSFILHVLLGVSSQAVVVTVLITGLAELFYHWNVTTPHFLGYFFQRPEMHRVHHKTGHHRQNFSDLPIWDMLFGTYYNPRKSPSSVGFKSTTDRDLISMLFWRSRS